jgi:hypothetical protein
MARGTGVNQSGRDVLRQFAEQCQEAGQAFPSKQSMNRIGAYIADATIQRMDAAVSPSGKPHKALSEEWIRYKVYGTTSEKLASSRKKRRDSARAKAEAAGRAFSPGGFKSKRSGKKRGGYSARIWQYTGESKRKVLVTDVSASSVTVVLNTP